ncbi:hypothetical protein Y032_0567g36 [Ancylostoma ceylanicum]|uniref:Uncharacterized protein n=1 Tax=Ancylostoma ceylanicum TaxID=53326 RepID=A0A016WNW8_9BILA|nr:hypothetical protein Y032_0567g36 [Ancylostoma ceylanicum]
MQFFNKNSTQSGHTRRKRERMVNGGEEHQLEDGGWRHQQGWVVGENRRAERQLAILGASRGTKFRGSSSHTSRVTTTRYVGYHISCARVVKKNKSSALSAHSLKDCRNTCRK